MNTLKFKIASILAAMILAISSNVQADNSATSTNDYTDTSLFGAVTADAGTMDSGWTEVLDTKLDNSGAPKDLIIGLSFETMLMTSTEVKSKGGSKSTAEANAEIHMYVTVDGNIAAPGVVTFDKRTQTLWAELGGVLESCEDTTGALDADGNVIGDGIITADECIFTDETIGLMLATKAAHTFNFVSNNIGSGSHVIKAYAQLVYDDEVINETSSIKASAGLGKGTLAVWEVHGSMTTK